MSTRQQQNGEEIQFLEQIQNQNGKLLSSLQLLYNFCVCMCFCDWICNIHLFIISCNSEKFDCCNVLASVYI